MAAATSMRQTVTMLVSLCVVVGIAMLAVAGMVYSYSFAGTGNIDLRQVWAPVSWNLGMLFLLLGILGNAVYRQTTDPLARLLLWLVALVVALLLVTAPGIFFTFG
jgi:L-asparagine transporter-like permease